MLRCALEGTLRRGDHTGGPRVTIDKTTVVLDEDGNEVVPGSGVRGVIAARQPDIQTQIP